MRFYVGQGRLILLVLAISASLLGCNGATLSLLPAQVVATSGDILAQAAANTATAMVSQPPAIETPTPTPQATATAPPLLQPYPYTTPLPPPRSTLLDGLYSRVIADPSTPTPCRRCAPFRVEGGEWQLDLQAGVYRLVNQATTWRTVGSFTVSGNELKLFNDPNCYLTVGTYEWIKTGSSLSLQVIEDECGFGLRPKNITTGVWDSTPTFPASLVDACQPPSLEAAISGHWPIPASCTEPPLRPATADICRSVSEIPVSECEALVAFYHSTGGPQWALKRGWLETDQPCGWTGLKCEEGHVTVLVLNYNQLSGSLPPELGQLSRLQTLTLYFNELSGSLPPELGRLAGLQSLILDDNNLSGPIPPELGQLTSLQELDLESNKLSGKIPVELGQLANLETLNLNNNKLSGPIPPELGNLRRLRGLFLAGNRLSGSVPPELDRLPKLWMINLRGNHLQGSLPGKLQNLPSSGYDFFKWSKDKPAVEEAR